MIKLIFMALLFGFVTVFSTSLTFLDDLSRPLSFDIAGDRMYVLEESVIKVFDLKGMKEKYTIGGEGEGPGEIKKTPFYRNYMKIIDRKVFVDSVDKILFFSQEGKLLREIKKRAFLMTRMLPVGENFVAKGLDRTDGRKEFIVVSLYNKNMEKINELVRQVSPIQPTSGQMIPDSVYFTVIDKKVFIDNSPKGFQILVFNENGKRLSPISKDVKKRTVTTAIKEQVMDEYKNDPLVKRIGFDNLKKSVNFLFPSYFPGITGLESSGGNLIVKTPYMVNGREIFYIMTSEGMIIKETALAPLSSDTGLDKNNAIDEQLISISNKILYALRENEEEEQWELIQFQL